MATLQSVYHPDGRPFPPVFLYGPPGTGKSHVLRAVSALIETGCAPERRRVELIRAQGDPPRFPDLSRLVSEDDTCERDLCGVALDDAHELNAEEQLHLWNLSNKLTRTGSPLIVAARTAPDEAFVEDPHLQSRITAGLVFRLEPPEDNVRVVILDKIARDRNIRLARDVGNYLVTRKSRNVKELENILEILDSTSLQLKRRITIPLVKSLEKEGII